MRVFLSIFALVSLPLGFGVHVLPVEVCTAGPFNNAEKQFILGIFNDVAQIVALGLLPGFPSSSNMAFVGWDRNLECISQNEADTCEIRVPTCPNPPNAPYGFMVGRYRSVCPYAVRSTYALSMVLTAWFEEHQHLDPRNAYNFQSCTAPNFSQMISGLGYNLGCGRVYDFDGQFYTMNLICAMNTAGNIIGEPLYGIGPPCSQCIPGTKCDRNYPGLCS